VYSISGSSGESISGSSRQSISGSSRESISGSSNAAHVSGNFVAESVLLFGPVLEVYDQGVNVLGQRMWADESVLDSLAASGVQVGTSVLAEAAWINGELRILSLEMFDDFSVPGVSPVFVAGTVSTLSHLVGHLSIGSVLIDANTLVGAVNVGDWVAITGTQPVIGGMVLGEAVSVLSSSTGVDRNSLSESGIQ
jgi:hypothetical protein